MIFLRLRSDKSVMSMMLTSSSVCWELSYIFIDIFIDATFYNQQADRSQDKDFYIDLPYFMDAMFICLLGRLMKKRFNKH